MPVVSMVSDWLLTPHIPGLNPSGAGVGDCKIFNFFIDDVGVSVVVAASNRVRFLVE